MTFSNFQPDRPNLIKPSEARPNFTVFLSKAFPDSMGRKVLSRSMELIAFQHYCTEGFVVIVVVLFLPFGLYAP